MNAPFWTSSCAVRIATTLFRHEHSRTSASRGGFPFATDKRVDGPGQAFEEHIFSITWQRCQYSQPIPISRPVAVHHNAGCWTETARGSARS